MIFRAFSSIWENIRGIQWLKGHKKQNFKKARNPKMIFLYKNDFYLGFDQKTKHVSLKNKRY